MPFLSDEERAQLKIQHKRERDKRIGDRIKTVLHCDKGWSPFLQLQRLYFLFDLHQIVFWKPISRQRKFSPSFRILLEVFK
jgi:hypothetical protein